MWTNQKATKLSCADSLTEMCVFQLFWALLLTEMTNLPTISFTSTSEILTLSYTWGVKKVPFSGWASPHRSLEGLINPQARQTIRDTKELGNRPLSHGDRFVSGDLKAFIKSLVLFTRLAVHKQSFLNLLRQNGCRVTSVYFGVLNVLVHHKHFRQSFRARSGVPWVRKLGYVCIREIVKPVLMQL